MENISLFKVLFPKKEHYQTCDCLLSHNHHYPECPPVFGSHLALVAIGVLGKQFLWAYPSMSCLFGPGIIVCQSLLYNDLQPCHHQCLPCIIFHKGRLQNISKAFTNNHQEQGKEISIIPWLFSSIASVPFCWLKKSNLVSFWSCL